MCSLLQASDDTLFHHLLVIARPWFSLKSLMGLATAATVVDLACPYSKFSWCYAFHFSFSDASQTICASETPFLSSFGSFSRLRHSSCPQAESRRTNSLLLQWRASSPGSQPFGLCAWRSGQYPFRSSFAYGVPGSSSSKSDHRGDQAASTTSLWCFCPAVWRHLVNWVSSVPTWPFCQSSPFICAALCVSYCFAGSVWGSSCWTPHSASSHFGSVRFIRWARLVPFTASTTRPIHFHQLTCGC